MELYDVMRTTFSAREFTDDPVPDEDLFAILDNARFASSGGNRQGWRVIVLRDAATKAALADLQIPAIKRYMAQVQAGESPFNTIDPTALDAATIEQTAVPQRTLDAIARAPVVLVVCVDLRVIASMDQNLPRVGVISGASIYPFVWNILLAARNEGYGGTLTTWAVVSEPGIRDLLGIPPHVAVAAVIPFGRPATPRTKLKRRPVSQFTTLERWDGAPLTRPQP
jgi:nitroreductase